MQNNVTELTHRLVRSLDSTYNVIDMPAVIEIVSLLEKVTITKELLETTRLGKYLNELRRKTKNDSLSKRAKELLKKWRNMVLPDTNGQQIKSATTTNPAQIDSDSLKRKRLATTDSNYNTKKFKSNGQLLTNCSNVGGSSSNNDLESLSDNSNSSFKDVIKVKKEQPRTNNPIVINKKLQQIQLQHHQSSPRVPSTTKSSLDRISSSSTSGHDVIIINSDSNSSIPDLIQKSVEQPVKVEEQLPKKRGRKKGSKNHKNLLDEAESLFCNKLASVTRGNTKVKTTQELIASLQNKNNSTTPINNNKFNQQKTDDLSIRAAKLTERVSIIDQKLNTNANRYKNKNFLQKLTKLNNNNQQQDSKNNVIESGSVINDKSLLLKQQQTIKQQESDGSDDDDDDEDDEIIIVDDKPLNEENKLKNDQTLLETESKMLSLSVEEALAQLPPIDKSVLLLKDDEQNKPKCTCCLNEISCDNNKLLNLVDNSNSDDNDGNKGGLIEENLVQQQPFYPFKTYEFKEDDNCLAKNYLNNKYYLNCDQLTIDKKVQELHKNYIPNVNGNYSLTNNNNSDSKIINDDNGLYINVVPNVNNECIPKNNLFQSENFKKYSISECNNVNNNIINDNNENSSDDKTEEKPRTENSNSNSEKKIFREWHQVVDTPSYNGEILKILPYVVID